MTWIVMILASASLYVSSLCASGVRALVLAVPTFVALWLFVVAAAGTLGRLLFRLAYPAGQRPFGKPVDVSLALVAIGGGLVALLLWFAFHNHRWTDHSAARTVKQALGITGYITLGVMVLLLLLL